ncbi:MARH3 ligase, partial [Calcarius ornatus]|nr:MARH3 ligase [Calcarius ornatus]
MRTNRCSHLPGVPPDHPHPPAPDGKSLPGSSGGLATSCPQYVMQVSSKDGQLLSSVVRTLAELLSPCECTGTLGTIHRSCLERWLSSSNTSYCELCHFRFAVERKPRPLVE